MSPKRLTPNDALFLVTESRETMMHVGSMLPFTLPADAPPDFLRQLVADLRNHPVQAPFNLRLRTPDFLKNPLQTWVEDDSPDLDYHVRRSALPAPGDERELGVLVSRLHGYPVDFTRPPWETHLIEGLADRNGRKRFAIYTKVHHSLIDGFTASKLLANCLSTDPHERERPLFFAVPAPAKRKNDILPAEDAEMPVPPRIPPSTASSWLSILRDQALAAGEVSRSVSDLLRGNLKSIPDLVGPLQAPMSILNRRITRNRRFATQQYPLDFIRAIAKAGGGTLNDAVLALCAGSLRRFLLALKVLPPEPLIVMLPVNVRPKDDPGGGNAVGSILASLATHIADPKARFDAIVASTRAAKEQLQGMSRHAIIQLSALLMLPSGLQHITRTSGRMRPQFNVIVSNVPGPDQSLYFRGARLEAVYPVSIPIHGQALNITCQSYAGTLNFGLTGCRDTLPSLQRLAVYMGEAVMELATALKVEAPPTSPIY
ncbi:MAG: wax ester/triacylglycerol synthase family O-acyltransferase [Myxococcales bacterium]|nr:wax ester/triacylglycerol synthase family O-acyltransferase [Myxococcales bacterium]